MSNLTLTTRHLSRTIRLHVGTFWLLCILSSLLIRTAESVNQHGAVDVENNEFAEFEDMDEPTVGAPNGGAGGNAKKQAEGGAPADSGPPASKPPSHDDAAVDDDEDVAEAVVEDDSDEFAHLQDEDEFENFDKERVENQEKDSAKRPSDQAQPLKFADVPAHFRSNWTNYQVELLVLAGLVVYLLNYVYGKTKNQTLAYTWFEEHRELLEQQFAVVGDDGSAHGTQPTTSHLIKETDSSFSIWCSGRAGCQGMLIQLKLLKRQDLVSVISQIIRPKYDRIVVRVELDNNEMDSFVFAVGQRKCLIKLVKDMTDLSLYTSEKKNADKLGLPASFTIFSEIAEATTSMIDPRVTQMITKYEDSIEYIHFSDQYSGPKPQEGETQTRLPEAASVLVFSFNIPGKMSASERHIEHVKPLINMVFYCIDKARRYRLSREGKAKADKNRQAAQEAFLKTTHLQRQEAAQARREEKTRERKQRLLEEEDPDRQRRLEKIEQKRDAKLKQPKMKQLKVKQ